MVRLRPRGMYGGSGMNLFAQKPVICHMVGVIGSMSFEGTWHYADHSASWPFSYTVEVKEDGLHLSDGASVEGGRWRFK